MLGVLLMLAAFSQAVANELRIPLAEQVTRRAMDEILDVATEVELEAYEGTEFHDRLQRARLAAGGQSSAVVFGLVTIVSTLVVTIGVVAVLVTVAPVLVPIAVLGYVPIAARQRAQQPGRATSSSWSRPSSSATASTSST